MSSQINGIANTNNDISIENNIIKLPLITTGNINLFAGSTNNANLSSVNSNVVPDSDNSRTLGTIEKQWSNAYIHDLSIVNIDVSAKLNPLFNDTLHLGSITKKWNIAYIKDLSNVNNINGQQYISNPNILTTTNNIYPSINDSISLGIPNKSWRNVNIRDLSTTNISVSGNIILNICGGTITNINKLTAPASEYKITSSTRLYQELSGDISWNGNDVTGYYGLAKDAYPGLNPLSLSSGVKAMSTWSGIAIPNDISTNAWRYVCWSSEYGLYVAVANSGTATKLIMTSNNGINWTSRTSSTATSLRSVCWSAKLKMFVAVVSHIIYSLNGVDWFPAISSVDHSDICWSPELGIFVTVGATARYSSNGTEWYNANINGTSSVCWSPELELFVVVGSYVEYSFNGTVWFRTTVPQNGSGWSSICWSSQIGLFVAVSPGDGIIYSYNGIT